ncbi:SDR family oxidoreductase [Roseateles sp.]|jgi:NAD(P)-dependent dehydrogenase (short-subunit alcohol dehydrogenase family)|uniref:SDR family oxidoreductase n=1 Tax=Roseateles sp. TaxID=1971397 RepID=UPI002DFE9364|nr:SDR family oxidoreductase [Roseateles sp.]
MKIQGSVALVTGANRGLGAAFVEGLLAAGASKVYAAARTPATVTVPGVIPVLLDVTRPDQIERVASELTDVNLLVNNAGIGEMGPILAPSSVEALRRQLETNAFGPLLLTQAFASTLASNQNSAVVNVLSALTWFTLPSASGAYSASKAAAWALSNALRQELSSQGTSLVAVHAGYIDTDLVRGIAAPKIAPAEVVRQTLAALEAGAPEVFADDTARHVHAGLTTKPPMYVGMGA